MRKNIFIFAFILLLFLSGKWILSNLTKTTTYDSTSKNSIPTSTPMNHDASDSIEAKTFSPDDAEAVGIKLDMERAEVEKSLGEPLKKESHYEGAFGADVIIYYYGFGTVRLEPLNDELYSVSDIYIEEPNYNGPRGISVGNNVEEVLQKFPYNKSYKIDENGEKLIYGKKGGNYGLITYSSDSKIKAIIYKYGSEGFGSYTLHIEINNDEIISIRIDVMNV